MSEDAFTDALGPGRGLGPLRWTRDGVFGPNTEAVQQVVRWCRELPSEKFVELGRLWGRRDAETDELVQDLFTEAQSMGVLNAVYDAVETAANDKRPPGGTRTVDDVYDRARQYAICFATAVAVRDSLGGAEYAGLVSAWFLVIGEGDGDDE